MDAPPDRPNYTRLKFQFSIVRHPQPTTKNIKYPDLNLTIYMKTLSLFFLAHLGLYLPLHGQVTTFSESELLEKVSRTPKSENLLGQDNGGNTGMLIHTSGMTITESYQSETQSTADTGASFDTNKINKNLSENLKNDQVLCSRTSKEDSAVQNRILEPLNIILATIAALIILGYTLSRMRSKRSKYSDSDTSV